MRPAEEDEHVKSLLADHGGYIFHLPAPPA
jgi:hypothetical protein